jgi:hypothetical protein
MAIVRAHVGLNFLEGISLGSSTHPVTFGSSKIVVTDDVTTVTVTGSNFGANSGGLTGTVTGFEVSTATQTIFEVSGLSLSLRTAANRLLDGDIEGLLALAFASDDQVFGSEEGDAIVSFAGNDVIDAGGGDDLVDGGIGTDTVLLDGVLADYEFTTTATGAIQIVDRNSANDSEGTDLLNDVERVRFSDSSEHDLHLLAANWHKSAADVELVASTYQFFAGWVPLAEGFEYLIDSDQNPNDLNDPYYDQFNRENRYINFASNLGTEGVGADAFEAKFGALNFEQTVKAAYLEIMGTELTGGALAFFLNGQGFYEEVAQARVIRQGVDLAEATKIVAIGSILNEAMKSGTGLYADAVEALVADVALDGQSPLLGDDLFSMA